VDVYRYVANMRESILASAAAVLLTCLPAQAAQITGSIIALDVLEQQLVLDDGSIYTLPKSVAVGKLALGSKVRVTYTSSDGTNTATAVVRAK
jgi:uncharacterized protein DUF1344